MKLQTIELQGFKSFQEYQDFSFDLDNGLYFVTGENKVETNLGANGAGKSALFEAICWCLYGKTSTNLKAGNVVNWENKGCQVTLNFDDMSQIIRTQSPNILQLNGNPVTQDGLENHLGGLGFESFLYSTFISQFSSKFFDLSPADKMVVFSDIMADVLEPWEVRSIKAKTRAVQMEVTIKGMERVVLELKGSLHHANQLDYSKQIKEFEANKKKQLDNISAKRIELEDRERLQKVELREAMQGRAVLQMDQKQFKSVISKKEYNELKDKYTQAINDQAEAKANYISLERELKGIEGVAGKSVCPTCLQGVDKKLLQDKIKSILADIKYWQGHYKEYENQVTAYQAKLRNFDAAIEKERISQSDLESKLRLFQMRIENLNTNLKRIEREIESAKSDINYTKGTKNQYAQLEKERQDDIKKFKAAIKDNEDLLGGAKKEFDAYQYWVGGFKSIRLLLLLDSLKELEISVNNNLNKLGLSDWSVKLDIDRETKSGTVRKGFSVLVCSPDNEDFVPMEVWSGGEMQRLKLAGSLGLMDLIQSKRQVDFGIEIFDEPTAWLSPVGISDLVQLLYDRAKENNKKLFLIDHKDLGSFGMFSGTINIVKDEKGSHMVEGL